MLLKFFSNYKNDKMNIKIKFRLVKISRLLKYYPLCLNKDIKIISNIWPRGLTSAGNYINRTVSTVVDNDKKLTDPNFYIAGLLMISGVPQINLLIFSWSD